MTVGAVPGPGPTLGTSGPSLTSPLRHPQLHYVSMSQLTCLPPLHLHLPYGKAQQQTPALTIPFPFVAQVKRNSVSFHNPHPGINLWRVPFQHQPKGHHHDSGSADGNSHVLASLWRHRVHQSDMAAVSIDSPEQSMDASAPTTVDHFYEVNSAPAVTPEEFLNELARHQPPADPRMLPYLTDIESYEPWKEMCDGCSDGHMLNTVLLGQSELNLCCLMSEEEFSLPGFRTASWYCKVAHSHFRAHVEQLFASSMNVCYLGGTTWWCIRRADWPKYEQFFIEYVKDEFRMDEKREWSEEQSRLLLALLYAKKTFIDPRLVAGPQSGIEVFQLNQKEGDVVILDGDIVHLGVCSEDCSINEAINFLPVSWLVSGLPRLAEWVRWLEGYINADEEGAHCTHNPTLHQVIFSDRIRGLVGKHCPRGVTASFLKKIKASVEGALRPSPNVMAARGEEGNASSKERRGRGPVNPRHRIRGDIIVSMQYKRSRPGALQVQVGLGPSDQR